MVLLLGIGYIDICEELLIHGAFSFEYLRIIGLHISKKSRTFALAKKKLIFG